MRIEISPATAGLNNAFFTEAGWVEKSGRGEYKPTAEASAFVQKFGFSETEAAACLAPAMKRSWYFTEIASELEAGPMPIDSAVKVLAQIAGAGVEYRPQLVSVIDWLEYVGLVVVADGVVQLGQRDVQDREPQERKPSAPGATVAEKRSAPAGGSDAGTTTEDRQNGGVQGVPTLLSLSFDLALTADDLQKLSAEQIKTLFEAVGAVAAVRASLE